MNAFEFSAELRARALGQFDLVGFASRQSSSDVLEEAAGRYQKWLAGGNGAGMEYLSRHFADKKDPDRLLPGWKSVAIVGLKYTQHSNPADDGMLPRISTYARGPDYHDVMANKLRKLSDWLSAEKHVRSFAFVDAKPVMERFWAWQAGLGWIGRNTNLINKTAGSCFFLGGLLIDAELQPDIPGTDHCGRCRKCIDACPTEAILSLKDGEFRGQTYIDSRRCIGYHTIENKGLIPDEIATRQATWIAGCDICQEVCPWNKERDANPDLAEPLNPAIGKSFEELSTWTPDDFKAKLSGHAMSRMKYSGFLRNLEIAVKNSKLSDVEKQSCLAQIEKNKIHFGLCSTKIP